jgi:uncharacterized protein (TIGR00369 family)
MTDEATSGGEPGSHIVVPGDGLSSEDMVEKLRQAFSVTPLHDLLGFEFVSIEPELVVVEMPVRAEAFNSSGNLHGGAIATLIDVAAGTAAARNSTFEPGKNTIVTADMHVRYLARAKGAKVRAEARVLRAGRQLVVVECQVLDEDGRIVASADFSSMVVPFREPVRGGDREAPDL